MNTHNRSLGRWGEDLVKKHLQEKKYKIIAQNFYSRFGEIDLVAFDQQKKELVFIEVKTRQTRNFGFPEDAVTSHKISHLEKAINFFRARRPIYQKYPYRLDVVTVEIDTQNETILNHLENINLP